MSQVSPARYVPYGYARQNQLLVSGVSGDAIEVWTPGGGGFGAPLS